MGLAAAELRREIENSRRFDLDSGESSDGANSQFGQICRQECAVKETGRLLIIGGSPMISNVIQMNCEFGGIERATIPQVFARSNNFVPRLECHRDISSLFQARPNRPKLMS